MSDTIESGGEDTIPAPVPEEPTLNLKVGSRGYAVLLLQQSLNVVMDGEFTEATKTALEEMQAAQGIPVTGEGDELTLSYLGLHWPPGSRRYSSPQKSTVMVLMRHIPSCACGRRRLRWPCVPRWTWSISAANAASRKACSTKPRSSA